MAEPSIATAEEELADLREKQEQDWDRVRTVRGRIGRRRRRIVAGAKRLGKAHRLNRRGVKRPYDVLKIADQEAHRAGLTDFEEFEAMVLAVLEKETGIPQRPVFGCDHGKQGGNPPFCGDAVTPRNGRRFLRALRADPWGMMNGVHWTQTTWFEKVFRVAELDADLNNPLAHCRVCFADLAVLRRAHGRREAFRRYNGSGPHAEAYARDAEGRFPRWLGVVHGGS